MNFFEYKIRPLTPRPLFAGDVKKRNEDILSLKSQPQGRNIKGSCKIIMLHSDKISFSTNIPD